MFPLDGGILFSIWIILLLLHKILWIQRIWGGFCRFWRIEWIKFLGQLIRLVVFCVVVEERGLLI